MHSIHLLSVTALPNSAINAEINAPLIQCMFGCIYEGVNCKFQWEFIVQYDILNDCPIIYSTN